MCTKCMYVCMRVCMCVCVYAEIRSLEVRSLLKLACEITSSWLLRCLCVPGMRVCVSVCVCACGNSQKSAVTLTPPCNVSGDLTFEKFLQGGPLWWAMMHIRHHQVTILVCHELYISHWLHLFLSKVGVMIHHIKECRGDDAPSSSPGDWTCHELDTCHVPNSTWAMPQTKYESRTTYIYMWGIQARALKRICRYQCWQVQVYSLDLVTDIFIHQIWFVTDIFIH